MGSYDSSFQGQPKGLYSDGFIARINPSGGVSWAKALGFVKGVVIEELYPLSIFNYFHNKMPKILKGYFKFSKTKIAD